MAEQRAWIAEGITARILALEGLEAAVARRDAAAQEAVRRLARNLRTLGPASGSRQLGAEAARLESATPAAMRQRLSEFLRFLRGLVHEEPGGRLRLLLVEPDTLTAKLLEAALAAPTRAITVAGSIAAALEAIAEHEVALILLDLMLPDGDGRQLLGRLRESPATAGIPVFVLAPRVGDQPRAECYALGADALFDKPPDTAVIAAAVASRLQRAGETAFQSRHDSLTGLPNRASFYETFDRLRAMAVRGGAPLSLALLQLDPRPGATTDGRIPDELLRRTASLLSMGLRDTDLVARWGGDTFALLLPRAGAADGRRALEKFQERLGGERFEDDQGGYSPSCSAGIVEVLPGQPVDMLLNQADRLLYAARSAGGHRLLVGDAPLSLPERRILLAQGDPYIAGAISRRLEREGFQVLHRPDGAAALQCAGATDVSLVMVDVDLPRIDGFSLVRQLRAMTTHRNTPVLMLAGLGEEAHIVRAFEAGADDYLLRPFASPELIARVRRLLTPAQIPNRGA